MSDGPRFAAWPARYAERMLAWAIAWPVLRLSLGRFPNRSEVHRFRRGFVDRPASMPALLRGLSTIPAVRKHLTDALTPGLPGRALLFLHIEKTAGTSVINYLQTLVPADEVDPDLFHGAAGHILSPVPADKRRYGLIWGHQDLPALLRCQPPERFVLTFLRDPRKRILSLYDFWHALRPEELARDAPHVGLAAAHSRSLLEFLQSPEPEVLDFVDNVYARRLTGIYLSHATTGEPQVTHEQLRERAMQALNLVDFIGIAERMAVSLQMLAARLGAPPPAFVPRENALGIMRLDPDGAFRKRRASRLGAAERACLDRLTGIDQAIYDAALLRFAAQQV